MGDADQREAATLRIGSLSLCGGLAPGCVWVASGANTRKPRPRRDAARWQPTRPREPDATLTAGETTPAALRAAPTEATAQRRHSTRNPKQLKQKT